MLPTDAARGECPHPGISASGGHAPAGARLDDEVSGVVVQPGRFVALVCAALDGSAALATRLDRFDDDAETATPVRLGDVRLADLPLDDLRSHVALVTQEHHVFVGTVADNLRLARADADDAALADALESVDAWDWVAALPDGLATEVGSGGARLTPAQAQQLALARLVLLDPHTLVLDEATSLLDPRAARRLEQSLSGVLEGRTVVAIAHRLHTAHDADRVAVVEDGRITEIGPHPDLIAADGGCAALWHSWQHE